MEERRSWRRVLRPGRADVERDVRDEVGFHLDMQIRELEEAGWAEEAARVEALRRFGDVPRVEHAMLTEDRLRERRARRVQWFGELWQDVGFALRQLRRNPGYAASAVLILGVGLGASAAVFRLVDGALVRALPIAEEERVVLVQARDEDGESQFSASAQDVVAWREGADFVGALAAGYANSSTLLAERGPERVITGVFGGDVMRVLGLGPLLGRSFAAGEDAADDGAVMIAERFWAERYDRSPAVIGQTVRLNDESLVIVGVMPHAATLMLHTPEVALWRPFRESEWMTPDLHFMRAYARLADGVTPAGATQRAAALNAALAERDLHGVVLTPVREVLVGNQRELLLVLFGAVLFVLAIVCANLASLTLSHALGRSREFAVRAALGAGGPRLIRQLLTESLVLAGAGGALGFGLAALLGHALDAVAGPAARLVPAAAFDARMAGFTLAAALVSALLFGLWPALRAGRGEVGTTLRESDQRALGGRAALRRRRLLVAAEVALSVVLLAGAGLLVRSLVRLMDQDPGFDARGTLAFSLTLPPNRYEDDAAQVRFFDALLDRLRALPGVESVGGGLHLPLNGSDTNGGFGIVGREFPQGQGPAAKKRIVTPGWFEALRIPVLHGRAFTAADRAGSRQVVIVSRAIAERFWPDEDPVGRRIRFLWGPGDEHEIIGVVGDVHHDGLDMAAQGMIYRPLAQFATNGLTVVVRSAGDPVAVTPAVRAAVLALDAQQPIYDVSTVQDVVRRSVGDRRTLMLVLGGFAATAVVLACLGIYAITAQSVAARRREIGVRMAVGAQARDVLTMVLGEESRVVLIGLVFGLAGAVAATRVLGAWLYGVPPRDPATFGAVTLLLLLAALIATAVPARRAARVDPVEALRGD